MTNTTTTGARYEVKCDECKTTISHTNNIRESYEGGTCNVCRVEIRRDLERLRIARAR